MPEIYVKLEQIVHHKPVIIKAIDWYEDSRKGSKQYSALPDLKMALSVGLTVEQRKLILPIVEKYYVHLKKERERLKGLKYDKPDEIEKELDQIETLWKAWDLEWEDWDALLDDEEKTWIKK